MDESSDAKARRYYDDFSRSYDCTRVGPYHEMIDRLEVDLAKPFVRGARVLEIGCGTGRILEQLAKEAAEAVGVDISEGMAARARARGLDVRLASVYDLPFEDERFDLVCSYKVLAHVPYIDRAIGEAVRVTRPGGHLLLEFYNPWSLRFIARRVRGPQAVSDDKKESDVYTRWDSPRAIPKLMPQNVDLIEYYGVRVVTPFAAAHRVSWLSTGLSGAETRAARSVFRYFGGFLVAVLRKHA